MSIFVRALAGFSAILCLQARAAWPATSSPEQSWETQVGQQRYMEYMQRGEIVPPQSPLYRTLDPIGNAIAAVANRQYFAPFHFVLLNEQTPNAFSMPGGNVYVTTALLSFLKNRDELAGVICHEVNHDIHHDMYAVFEATQGGRSPHDPNVIAYERAAETNADRAGAYMCAKAGFNPWGMVWNFRQYRQAMGVSNNGGADHPSDDQREADLVALFQSHKATFGKFNDDVASATPLALPAQMGQRQYSPYYPRNIRRIRNTLSSIRSNSIRSNSIRPIRRPRPLPVIRAAVRRVAWDGTGVWITRSQVPAGTSQNPKNRMRDSKGFKRRTRRSRRRHAYRNWAAFVLRSSNTMSQKWALTTCSSIPVKGFVLASWTQVLRASSRPNLMPVLSYEAISPD